MIMRKRAGRIRRKARFLRRFSRSFLAETAQHEPAMPMVRRVRHLLCGYHPLEGSWYDQVHGSTDGCISNFERETAFSGLNGPHGYLLGNKLIFSQLMAGSGFPHPRVFGFTHASRWTWLHDGEQVLRASLAAGEQAVIKPTSGRKGASIEFISSLDALAMERAHDVIVTPLVGQADYAARIFSDSLNTIRILTVIPEDGTPLVAAAVHRFGASHTNGVDNFSAGGIVARVDLESGLLEKAAMISPGNILTWTASHPETESPIEHVEVPFWCDVKRLTLRLCAQFPFLKYVGWDIAVTDQGPVVIEGNAHPSLRFFQLYEPILKSGHSDFFKQLL